MNVDLRLKRITEAQPYPLLFATISGAHLYGFPSPDSDFDLRGAHVLPLDAVVGLDVKDETVQDSRVIEGLEMDISPLVVHTTPEHEELKAICGGSATGQSAGEGGGDNGRRLPSAATGVVTKHHAHHYFGFAETQWKLFLKESPRRVKPLLYVYRVLLTGIHLMRTGVIEANILTSNEEFRLPFIADLVARKLAGPENLAVGHQVGPLSDFEIAFHEAEYQRLRGVLQSAHEASQLPELPSEETRQALNDLLVRVRLKMFKTQ